MLTTRKEEEDIEYIKRINRLKARHQSLQSRTSDMNNDITELRGWLRSAETCQPAQPQQPGLPLPPPQSQIPHQQMALPVEQQVVVHLPRTADRGSSNTTTPDVPPLSACTLRKTDNDKLIAKIGQLESDKLELRRMMIVCQLAQSVQHYIAKQFPPHVFTTKFTHQCTFEDIQSKTNRLNSSDIDDIFNNVSAKFMESGVVTDVSDIGPMIKEIRELGTGTSHPNTMIRMNEEGVFEEFVPSADDVREIIKDAGLSDEYKSYAGLLVDVLEDVVPHRRTDCFH